MDKYKLRLDLFDEDGNYIVELLSDKGFVKNTISVPKEQLGELMVELTKEDELMLDTVRKAYQLFDIKTITFEDK